MSRKLFCLAVVVIVIGTICVSAFLASAAPQGKGNDRVLSKIKFIHFRRGHAKPPWAGPPNGGDKEKEEGYYSYIAKGAKWKEIEDYLLNPANEDGVIEDLVQDAVAAGMNEWETPEDNTFIIFGSLKIDNTVEYNDGAYREYNTISFGSYDNPDVIAIATVWGYFTGPPSQREIVEAHILMNDNFEWGDAIADGTLMDIQNIVTHELGHCVGMGDVYQLDAGQETMYGYSTEGETTKRDLYNGDITGITRLYK
jgi:hypothetical protein